MSTINSYLAPAAHSARPQTLSPSNTANGPDAKDNGASFSDLLSDATAASAPAASKGTTPDGIGSVPEPPGGERFMMPMQRSWIAPEIPDTPPEYPLHPKYGVPMVSEETLNRYIHPLQTLGAIPPNETASEGDIGTSVFRVAPGGMQDFVASDGFRHRFDVEIVYPSPSSLTWQGRDAKTIHPEVADFAAESLKDKLAASGIEVSNLEIEPFRMLGGTPSRPWFLDQLVLKLAGKTDLPVSLNVAMRDPEYTVSTIRDVWDLDTELLDSIPS